MLETRKAPEFEVQLLEVGYWSTLRRHPQHGWFWAAEAGGHRFPTRDAAVRVSDMLPGSHVVEVA